MSTMMSTILLVDGYKLTRHCLRQLVAADARWQVVETADMSEARCAIPAQSIDLALIDLSDPAKSGLETFCDLKALLPTVPVVVVNGEEDDMQIAHYQRLGCQAYLTRHASAEHVRAVVAQALTGEQVWNAAAPPFAGAAPQAEVVPSHRFADYELLSFRELQIFLKLLRGKSTSLIARELGIAASSVSVFKARLLQKLQLATEADLIAYALRSHLVRLPDGRQAALPQD